MSTPAERFFPRVFERARKLCPVIAFPEADEPRILAGAVEAHRLGLCRALLVGSTETLHALAVEHSVTLPDDAIMRDPATDEKLPEYAEEYREGRRRLVGKTIPEKAARRLVSRPLFFAGATVHMGEAAGMVAGARETTGDVLTAAIGCIGMQRGVTDPTGAFVMVAPDEQFGHDGVFVFADPAVMPTPSPSDLARIAAESATLFEQVVGEEPRVALLSFSTAGSADHPMVEAVREAGRRLAAMQPEFPFDVEVQLDAAVMPGVAARKHPTSRVKGRANVFVFPDLNAANIAYKLAERLGGVRAIGPFTLGLRAPISDLSRGCSVDDIIKTTAILACRTGTRDDS